MEQPKALFRRNEWDRRTVPPNEIWRGCERREETRCVMTSDPLENRPISPQRISLDRINIVSNLM